MRTLTLRNVSEDTLHWLRGRAAAQSRSVSAELLDLIAVAGAKVIVRADRDRRS